MKIPTNAKNVAPAATAFRSSETFRTCSETTARRSRRTWRGSSRGSQKCIASAPATVGMVRAASPTRQLVKSATIAVPTRPTSPPKTSEAV